MMKKYSISPTALHWIAASVFALVLFGASGCTNSGASRNARTNDEAYEQGNEQDYDDEELLEDESADVQNDRSEVDRRNQRPMTQRQRDHRRSLQNMGSWFLTALIGIGINILLALLLWG